MTRRNFLAVVPSVGLVPSLSFAMRQSESKAAIHPEFPRQVPDKAREFVGVCHRDLNRVKEMLAESPNYAKAAWDWGFGDWETGLGAASHVGNKEIAQELIKHGARPDPFYFAMMGHLDALKALIAAQPGLQRVPGPHGLTLLHHAKAGEHAATISYLELLGDADQWPTMKEISAEEKERYLGRYAIAEGDELIVALSRQGGLTIKRGEKGNAQNMHRVEEHAFATPGAPHVRLRFAFEGERAVRLTVEDVVTVLVANRTW